MTMTMYQAQLNTMVMWFDGWSSSGQTVALFKMLTRLCPVQARFVSIALDHSLNECNQLALTEQQANNPSFVSQLMVEEKECGMRQALLHLPLLRPGNCEARQCYLGLIPALVHHTLETGHLIEEAKQLLSYALIHPAFKDDRKILEPLRRSLGEKIITGLPGGTHSTSTTSPNASDKDSQAKTRRSNSLTPPTPVTPNTDWTSQVRRFSLSSDHSVGGPPLSPQSSQASSGSGSETQLDTAGCDTPAMRDVRSWLKSLRLHKYWRLFSQLSYDQMLSLTEENFEASLEPYGGAAVTQGARRKIILSIAKLRERPHILNIIEQEVLNGGNLCSALEELRCVLATPIQPCPAEGIPVFDDIPSLFTSVLGKVCTQMMVSLGADDESRTAFISVVDSTLHHEAFTDDQKKRLSSWRAQVALQIKQSMRIPGAMGGPGEMLCKSGVGCKMVGRQPGYTGTMCCPAPRPITPRPVTPSPFSHHTTEDVAETEPEINSRLESLCLRMTEHALGGTSE